MQCPKQFYEIRVRKSIPFIETDAIKYGKALHSAAEFYIKANMALPAEFAFMQSYLDKFIALPGKKYVELQMGMVIKDRAFVHCDYWDSNCWYRGVSDFISVDHDNEKAYLVDFKTSKSAQFADLKQMALLAALIFLHFPKVKTVKSMLLFVKAGSVVKSEYTFDDRFKVFAHLNSDLKRLKAAFDSGTFNASPNNFCRRFCAVTSCHHNGNYSE